MRKTTIVLLASLGGCSGDPAGGADAAPPPPPAVTWHQDIAPIVHERCVGCHRPGGIGPFSAMTYDDVWEIAPMMLEMIETGQMPPWDAIETDDCAPRHGWQEDPRLSAEEQALFREWVELGVPAGDAATAAPLPPLPDDHIDGVTHRMSPENPFVTSGQGDDMICFYLQPDPIIAQPTWLEAIEFTPGNLGVVHHAVLLAVPEAEAATAQTLAGPDGLYECFGGTGIDGAYTLGVWVPGSTPFEALPDTGIPLAPGATMLLQIHYHPAGEIADPDATEVAMRLTTTAPARNMIFTGIGNAFSAPNLLPGPNDRGVAEFRIPAGVADHTERMSFPIELDNDNPARFPIVAVFPHMHYIGVDLEAKITRAQPAPGEPAEECLFKTPQWDFNWQRTYFYDAPMASLPTIGDGDVISLACRYDNTLDNPFVQLALDDAGLDEPVDVFLGEETLDEMCLAGFAILF
jgi:hypothetical protein